MDFFAQQDRSRRQTRWLIFLFIMAVVAIVAVVDLALLVGFGGFGRGSYQGVPAQTVQNSWALLAGGSIATVAVIGFSSLFRTLGLRGGGGKVAEAMGGVRLEPDERDLKKRRLINVVEEIALASGVPAPQIYVLEHEPAINAFAAGFSPSDAAVAVTRGTLDKLDRNELQGVIAHEFSHILNGDMRLNVRLMGALFGILVLAIIGRRVLFQSRAFGRSRNRNASAILLVAVALLLVGYVGQFFGRWIKAAVSRQREYLADASAVQFTREPEGISGALKKIAVYTEGSSLVKDPEEVGHMLFGSGRPMTLFATHPPLLDRIRRIEPSFDTAELQRLSDRLERAAEAATEAAAQPEQPKAAKPAVGGVFRPDTLLGQIGKPDFGKLVVAAAVAASLPESVQAAAHDTARAPEALLYTLIHEDPELQETQLLAIARHLGSDAETRVRHLLASGGQLSQEQKLPVLEMSLPALHRHSPEQIRKLLATVDEVIRVDGQVEVFEYLAARMVRQYAWESANPHRVKVTGKRTLADCRAAATHCIAVLATEGDPADSGSAARAFADGMQAAFPDAPAAMPEIGDWPSQLDDALDRLDELNADGKRALVAALVATATSDHHVAEAELELLRAICGALHVPVPMIGDDGPAEPSASADSPA